MTCSLGWLTQGWEWHSGWPVSSGWLALASGWHSGWPTLDKDDLIKPEWLTLAPRWHSGLLSRGVLNKLSQDDLIQYYSPGVHSGWLILSHPDRFTFIK